MSGVNFFGIRHLSPAGGFFLEKFLDEIKPECVLIEAPRDFEDMLRDIVRAETKPPFAILAYTTAAPVRTVLYPFAEYSPEYRAVLWAHKNGVPVRFTDLPSKTFLALYEQAEKEAEEENGKDLAGENRDASESKHEISVYEKLDVQSGEGSHETFWERTLEHCADVSAYFEGSNLFGASIRELSRKTDSDAAELELREAHMRSVIRQTVADGYAPEKTVVVTGSYHVEGLRNWETPETLPKFPAAESLHTLMPYSYYRLSTRSGYGAGNKAPAYYELIWEGLKRGEPLYAANAYLSKIAAFQRENGFAASSAQVIEALRLAGSLAKMRGGSGVPVLRDLRDAAETCLGEGSFAAVSTAVADTEIGTKIGALPEGVSRTSIQDDFYRQLKELKLDKYRTVTAQDLRLDLRENRRASSERSAFLDLNRSFFLQRLRVLDIGFAQKQNVVQENATWSEGWTLRWSPEAEIRLVESALRGDTVELAASFALKERTENAAMSDIAEVIEDAFLCGMPEALGYAVTALQAAAVDAVSFEELSRTAFRLSNIIGYGDIRKVDNSAIVPILKQLYYRACLILTSACACDDAAAKPIAEAMNLLNSAELARDFLNTEDWLSALRETARRDDLNTVLSGLAAAILLERSQMTSEELKTEVSRRLSRGVPAELGAGWFEGLTMKNRYGLIARLSLWESLDEYIKSLDDEEFKRALVFLRRAFSDFSAAEKDSIAENLGELWGLNGAEVSETLNAPLDAASQEQIAALDDFDFDI